MNENYAWGIRAGQSGDADTLFLKENCVAIGWSKVGDLSKLPADREAFKAALVAKYPWTKPGAVPTTAGMLYRFAHEIQPGDFVIYPSKRDRCVHLGTCTGPYHFDASDTVDYGSRRPVKWEKSIPRTQFSQGALNEIGSALSLFQVRNYLEEFKAAFAGKSQPVPVATDPAIAAVSEDSEQSTRDFILKTLAQKLKGHPFEDFVAHLLQTMGYRTRGVPEGPDGGVDIIAHRDELGFEPPLIKVEVKSTEGTIGNHDTSALYGHVSDKEFGLLVCLGSFTKQAKDFAKSKSNLRLIDGEELVDLILARYEQFDSHYKSLLPLKRIYVPEPVAEE
jgi:restriction system protein